MIELYNNSSLAKL